MHLGKIATASSHVDYVCQVARPGETEAPPRPADYGFGTFVGIATDDGCLVGVIHNTTLLNPEFGNLGPRLSPPQDLAVFSPDYVSEQMTVVAVYVLGAVDAAGHARQGVPSVAAHIDAPVRTLDRAEVAAFHRSPAGVQATYLPALAALQTPLAAQLQERILDELAALFPEDSARLGVLRTNVAWRARVMPAG